MKKIFSAMVLPLLLFSCQQKTSGKLTAEEISNIQSQVSETIQQVFGDSVNIDLEKSFTSIWNSPDFHYLLNGEIFTYGQLKSMEAENLPSVKKQVFDFKYKDIDVVDKSCAIAYLQGILKTTYPNDSVSESAIAETVVLKLVDSQWKIAADHESYSCDSK